MKEIIPVIAEKFRDVSVSEMLLWFSENYPGKIVFSTSLSAEDQVITHHIYKQQLPIRQITLDTGRLFQETLDLLNITEKKYDLKIDVYFPERQKVEEMVNEYGINLFYDSIENRRRCCSIRKTDSLKRALDGMEVWITGMRQEQSVTRLNSEIIEWDDHYRLIKVNPLIRWTHEEVWNYIRDHGVPINELHRKGFPSIGCMPCTRAVGPGENLRAGRWWWESPEYKECGLHKPNDNQ